MSSPPNTPRWLTTEAALLDAIENSLRQPGAPSQRPYSDHYIRLFLNAQKVGGPTADRMLDVMNSRGLDAESESRLRSLWEMWGSWWLLMEVGLRDGSLDRGIRGPYYLLGQDTWGD